MKTQNHITLRGLTTRGKNRIKEHGETFNLLLSRGPTSFYKAILVESLGNTFRGEKWLGWFEVGIEVEIVVDKPSTK